MIFDNVVDLVEDSAIFAIDPEDWAILNEGTVDLAVKGALKGAGGQAADLVKGAGAKLSAATQSMGRGGHIGQQITKVGEKMAANPQTVALAALGTVVAAAGAAAIVKYLNSIWRLQKLVDYYGNKAKAAGTPEKKAKFAAKVKQYTERLKLAQSKARAQKAKFITQTKEMQTQLASMKKSKADPKSIAKLEKKLDARSKVMSKIGAI